MAFTAEISRTNPACILFLVDQSSSMDRPFGGEQGKKKSEGVADAINRLLQNLVLKCAKADGVRDYFHVGVIGYGESVAPCLAGTSKDQPLAPISTVANNPIRLEQRMRVIDDGAGGLVEQTFRFPVWFEPTAGGKTPMNEAVVLAREVVTEFISVYPDSFPPLVINLTDGQPTDANPLDAAVALKSLKSTDGNCLFFNAHLSGAEVAPICFPSEETGLPDKFAKLLFRMSSILPPKLMAAARDEGFAINGPARGFVFNGDLVAIIRFLDIGTRVAAPGR
jgi:hypothetical protein